MELFGVEVNHGFSLTTAQLKEIMTKFMETHFNTPEIKLIVLPTMKESLGSMFDMVAIKISNFDKLPKNIQELIEEYGYEDSLNDVYFGANIMAEVFGAGQVEITQWNTLFIHTLPPGELDKKKLSEHLHKMAQKGELIADVGNEYDIATVWLNEDDKIVVIPEI